MENSIDSYLHKKFKKQLSVELKSHHQQHKVQNESKSGVVDAREEKTDNQTRKDNNESVPNQSTNNQNSSLSSSRNNFSKSSISLEECRPIQSSNSCISWSEQSKPSFDTTTEPVSTSSILDNLYSSKQNYVKPEDVSSNIAKDHEEEKSDGHQAQPDKSSAGKYVCPYCSLVCSKPSVLQKHIRAHTNERPYPCNSCGFSFKTRSNLYKHCRSRTHANRVMGNKVQEINNEGEGSEPKSPQSNDNEEKEKTVDLKTKPYKPRFHTKQFFKENEENKEETNKHNSSSNLLSDHINDIISKNNSIVNSADPYLLKKRSEVFSDNNEQRHIADLLYRNNVDEPLNLTKNRKRSMSEVVEPVAQKSLIKELLLKNLNSDMQCPHCKMIFQTVTELELHKLRSCKGFVQPGAKYTRSSSVNVASILTQNKNAFDGIPHLQNTFLPLKSPGPFLGKTRLVESDKSKSFSFDDGLPTVFPSVAPRDRYLLSPLTLPSEKEKKTPVKLFGGEVKITQTTGETKSFKIDNKDDRYDGMVEYSGKVSENRVVKSGLQSGGTVLTNKANYPKDDFRVTQDVIRVYENSPVSPNIDISNLGKPQINFTRQGDVYRSNDVIVRTQIDQFSVTSSSYKYTNIMDFSQKAVKLLTPNLKQPNLSVPGVPAPTKFTFPPTIIHEDKIIDLEKPKEQEPQNLTTKVFQPKVLTSQSDLYNPMKLLVNGKVVRYVPGIPGPVAAEEPLDMAYASPIVITRPVLKPPPKPEPKVIPSITKSPKMESLEVKTDFPFKVAELKSPKPSEKSPVKISEKPTSFSEPKKFARPNSLALKPTTASLKQHHGLTPTMFNQILISPDTPRVAKKYVQQFLHGNYFSYLGLKSSTKPVYCTLNKTQPFYVPHFKKLSMYSEWRQQDTKTEKLFVSAYDSRQRHLRYTTAGKATADLVVHSSYKFVVSETSTSGEKNEEQKSTAILGGYECNDDYTYVRGRGGRGRYVCDQCGIRCKKPSMLKKHIRTHSNDRPYTCNHCNFSFKTKGNLTKHMKSKAHTKNYAASGSGSSTQQSGTQSSESDTEDSGMDSSDESTRREEHEAAYGLLSLAQKTSQNVRPDSTSPIGDPPHNVLNTEEIAHASKANYVKNKILDDKAPINFSAPKVTLPATIITEEARNLSQFLGRTTTSRPLTYPYTTLPPPENHGKEEEKVEKSIKQFHVIQKYTVHPQSPNKVRESPKPSDSSANCFEKVTNVKSVPKDRTRVLINNDHVKVNNVQPPVLKVNDSVVSSDDVTDLRKRKLSYVDADYDRAKQAKNDEVMDLSMPTEKEIRYNGSPKPDDRRPEAYHVIKKTDDVYVRDKSPVKNNGYVVLAPIPTDTNVNYVMQEGRPPNAESPKSYKSADYDNSAMETLADIATKQVKLEKNTLAKSVASEFLKMATKNESGDSMRDPNFLRYAQDFNDLIARSEGNKCCLICAKSFSKAPQLRLHMNIHYLERPYRCHSCSVSFRTRGHLQKHERSASHNNKLSSSPALSSSEPRPFKCVDCNIAFRIHGHLAKHLRSKMHIMKLECLAKIPFGLYAELERSNSLLTEINTADGDQCLESLKTLAKKVFINDPSKLNQLNSVETTEADS